MHTGSTPSWKDLTMDAPRFEVGLVAATDRFVQMVSPCIRDDA